MRLLSALLITLSCLGLTYSDSFSLYDVLSLARSYSLWLRSNACGATCWWWPRWISWQFSVLVTSSSGFALYQPSSALQYSLFGDSDQYKCPKWRRSCTNRRDCTGKSREWSSGTRDRGGPPESQISHPPTMECTTTKAETAKLKSYHQVPSRQSGSHCTRLKNWSAYAFLLVVRMRRRIHPLATLEVSRVWSQERLPN